MDLSSLGQAGQVCETMCIVHMLVSWSTQLLESPIPATTPATTTTTSQKASSGDISGTKRNIIDPLVSKRPEKNSE